MCGYAGLPPGTRLVVAHAAAVPTGYLESAYYEEALERSRERAAEVLEDVAARVDAGGGVETAVLNGPPARSLVELAQEVGAGEIAVGSRGFGRFRAAALGSTSHALLHESDRPVLLITRRAVQREVRRPVQAGPGRATIVTGFDGSVNARAALGYAAERLGAAGDGRIVATYAYDAPSDWLGRPYFQRALDEHQQRGREVLGKLEQEGLDAGGSRPSSSRGRPLRPSCGWGTRTTPTRSLWARAGWGASGARSGACRTSCCTRRICRSSWSPAPPAAERRAPWRPGRIERPAPLRDP